MPLATGPHQEKDQDLASIPVGEGPPLKLPSLGLHENGLGLKEEVQILPALTLTVVTNTTHTNKSNYNILGEDLLGARLSAEHLMYFSI